MNEPPKKDANDVVREGGTLGVVGEPIDPSSVVVSMDAFRSKRSPGPASSSAAPPVDDTPMPGDGDGPGDGDRPRIVVTTEEAVVNAAAVVALARIPNVYVRGNALTRVLRGHRGRSSEDLDAPVIDMIPKEVLQEKLSEAARWVKLQPGKGGGWDEVPQHPPRWTVGNVHLRGEWAGLPPLLGVVETPVLRRDGTILGTPGYDRASALYYAPKFKPLLPPERPTAEDVKAAIAQLDEVVCDVMFAQPAHRSTWFASVLTPLARAAFDGPAPLFLFEAPVAGTGKGLLVHCAVQISTGRGPAIGTYTSKEEDMQKQIVAWGSSGRNVVMLDEVTGKFDSAALRSVLTGDQIEGRVLGLSKMWSGPNLITWYATGNNVRKGQEMYRRIAPVHIHSPVEDPSKRAGFRHPDLRGFVTERQRELTCAALTILRAYCVAGRPKQALSGWGSFERWSDLIRSALVWAGLPDPNEANEGMREEEDTQQAAGRALAEQWIRLVSMMNQGPRVTAKDAVRFVMGDPAPLPDLRRVLEEIASDKDGKPNASRLGWVLRSIKGSLFNTPVGVVRFETQKDRTGTAQWSAIVVRPPDPAGGAGDAGDGLASPNKRSADPGGTDPSPASPATPASLPTEKGKKIDDDWGWNEDD